MLWLMTNCFSMQRNGENDQRASSADSNELSDSGKFLLVAGKFISSLEGSKADLSGLLIPTGTVAQAYRPTHKPLWLAEAR